MANPTPFLVISRSPTNLGFFTALIQLSLGPGSCGVGDWEVLEA